MRSQVRFHSLELLCVDGRSLRPSTRRGVTSRLAVFLAAAWFTGAAATAGEQHHAYRYYYFKQPSWLELDVTRIVVFWDPETHPPGFTADLSALGLPPERLSAAPLPGWYFGVVASTGGDEEMEKLVGGVAASGLVDFASPVFYDLAEDPVFVTRDIFVGFRSCVDESRAAKLISAIVGGVVLEVDWGGLPGVYRVRSDRKSGFEVLRQANELARERDVEFAEPDLVVTGRFDACVPTDPGFAQQWGLNQSNDIDVDAMEAWAVTTGLPSVRILLLDVGVQQDHPDINQIPGQDFVVPGSGGPVNACDNHGTQLAGVISALMNSTGGVGVSPGCTIVSARIGAASPGVPPCGNGFTTSFGILASGISYSLTCGARITNSSFSTSPSATVTTAYQYTRNNGVIHFASAGNNGQGMLSYPASLSTVNAVAAITPTGVRASFSQYGAGLDFCAPGQGIYTTDRTGAAGGSVGDTITLSGTSLASAFAAGAAALACSAAPGASLSQIEAALRAGCRDLGADGYDTEYGFGLIRAFAAQLAFVPPPQPPAPFVLNSPYDGESDTPQKPLFAWQSSSGALRYRVMVDDDAAFRNPELSVVVSDNYLPLAAPLEQDRTYYWRVVAENCTGETVAGPAAFLTLIDCNLNQSPDALDIADGTSHDCNQNGCPDDCDFDTGARVSSLDLTPINRLKPQTFTFAARPARHDVTLVFEAYADLNLSSEFITVRLNGLTLGSIFGSGGSDCAAPPSLAQLIVPAATFNAALSAGQATIQLIPSAAMDELCELPTWISVVATYDCEPVSSDHNSDGIPDECSPEPSRGDLNCDAAIDVLDINPFVLALLDPGAYAAAYPECDAALADINQDGAANVLDINPFISLILGAAEAPPVGNRVGSYRARL